MMDSREEIRVPEETGAQPNLPAVERLYELIDSDGVLAGIEHLLTFCHEDVEMRAYAAQAGGAVGDEAGHELLHGRDAVMGFFRGRLESGFGFRIRARGFEVD